MNPFRKDKAAPLSVVPVAVIDDGKSTVPADQTLVALALKGWTLKQQITALEDELGGINAQLLVALDPGTALHIDSVVRIPVTQRETWKVINPDELRAVLGMRYADLVSETVSYKLSDRCKALIANGDDPVGRKIAECVTMEASPSLSYRAAKPVPKR